MDKQNVVYSYNEILYGMKKRNAILRTAITRLKLEHIHKVKEAAHKKTITA